MHQKRYEMLKYCIKINNIKLSAYNTTDRYLSTVMVLTFSQMCGIIMVQRDTQYPKCIGLGASSGAIAGGEHIPRHFLFKGVQNEGIKYFYR